VLSKLYETCGGTVPPDNEMGISTAEEWYRNCIIGSRGTVEEWYRNCITGIRETVEECRHCLPQAKKAPGRAQNPPAGLHF